LCVGGTLKGKNIELQGDQMKRASEYLSKEHYKLVQSGG
jgi:translation initiation factor 1 (eIF-1/SUI1)